MTPPGGDDGSARMGRIAAGRVRHASVVLADRVLVIGGEPNHWQRVTELR